MHFAKTSIFIGFGKFVNIDWKVTVIDHAGQTKGDIICVERRLASYEVNGSLKLEKSFIDAFVQCARDIVRMLVSRGLFDLADVYEKCFLAAMGEIDKWSESTSEEIVGILSAVVSTFNEEVVTAQ